MIPILYNADEKLFVNNGRGRLSDAIRCIVTEERNGIYELEIDYPIKGVHFDEIERGRIIAATHDDKKDVQPFVIYARTVPDLRGIVTFYAHHISYKLSEITVMPFTAGSCMEALQGIKEHSINTNPFNFWTDKTTTASYDNDVPRNARNMLGGEQNSILDVFGSGEYQFDRFDVKLYAHRGEDTNVEIRYGKNLINLNQTIDDSGTYNAIVPFWKSSEGELIMLPERLIVYSGLEPQIAYLTDHNLIIIRTETGEPIEVAYRQIKAVPMDLSDQFEETPTVEQLRSAAQARFECSEAWAPAENIEVDFVQLWQTEEYKEYSALQRVSLCDTVSVYYPQAGINAVRQKVVKTVYNVLLDRYDSIELGQAQASLAQAIKTDIMQDVPTTSMMDEAIQYATNLIRGGLGGYVVMTPGPNGYPQEILIMDTPDIDTAVNVWRFNEGGLGHSHRGYDGPFDDIALTQDGKINATMITTGILNASLIRAGILQDVNGNVNWNLTTGVLNMTKGSINLGFGAFTVNDSGYLTATTGKIGPFLLSSDGLTYSSSYHYTSINENAITNTYRTDWQAGGSSIRGTQLRDEGLFFVGSIGGTNPKSFSEIYSFSLSQVDSGGSSEYFELDLKYKGSWFISYSTQTISITPNFYTGKNLSAGGNCVIDGNLRVYGTKNRAVKTSNYNERLLYSYETPTPLFGDIGEAVLDEEGFCYVDIDDIFSETVADTVEYQVFIQKEGEGDCYIAEKDPRYFVIKGTPGLKVAWELKAKQKDYQNYRLEQADIDLDEYETIIDEEVLMDEYIQEQEEILYGYN